MTTAPEPDVWADGAIRGVRKAAEFSGLSRHEIQALTDSGAVAWFPHGERGDRIISRRSLVAHLAREHSEYAANRT